MKLTELLKNIDTLKIENNSGNAEIISVEYDSRKVVKNSLFVAIKGFKTDGHLFIEKAIENGASAVVLEDENTDIAGLLKSTGTAGIKVSDSRKSMAQISDYFYGHPSRKMKLVGVTGTKGKTTTTFYIKSIFENAGFKCGLIGTIENYIGEKAVKALLTTPQSNEINELMYEMVNEGCKYCVMEVSSVAADLSRVDYLDFDYGVFTNITSDHMDYHKTFGHYLASKKKFFDTLKPEAKVIANIEDPHWREMTEDTKARVFTYGKSDSADFAIENIHIDFSGTTYSINQKNNGKLNISTNLAGLFNAYNSTAAFTIGKFEDLSDEKIKEGIASLQSVPGRFEVINHKSKTVIVDYSHTSDSLEQVLNSIRIINGGKKQIVTVFGCGGDRDKTKRPVMGEIAARLSDYAIVTSDNPRTENPFEILEEVKKGIKTGNYEVIENRDQAIRQAIFNSEESAVILIAGKGHENYQEINGVKSYFSDKDTAEKYLKEWQN